MEEALKCPHSKITADTTFGRFLVNMIDSVPAVKKYTWEGKYKRLAFVTIANAAGKKVVVSNILGQTIAAQVLTSDNAVIAAPQGVVVVAVEGEDAVKAIVK